MFARLREQWFPPLDCTSAEWVAVAQAALHLDQHFDGQSSLARFSHALYPEVNGGVVPPAPLPPPTMEELRAVNQTLQVMEMTWAAMKLHSFHAHPLNRGWMNTFRRWTTSVQFQLCWPFLRGEYSRPFVQFCEDILNVRLPDPRLTRIAAAPSVPPPLAELDLQLVWEWADLFDRLHLPAAAFPRAGLLADTLANAVIGPPPQDGGASRSAAIRWLCLVHFVQFGLAIRIAYFRKNRILRIAKTSIAASLLHHRWSRSGPCRLIQP